jgi:2-dehydro-3-deoxyphosphogluconate aldolase/(4S)-4-hydroxy-2-oxoglutarate aldolase
MTTRSLTDLVPVVPVVVLDDLAAAVPLAQALAAGGVPVVELTLRTPVALEAIRRITEEVPEVLVGAGTVVSPGQAKQAADAGAQFLVSPGATPRLLDEMADTGLPHLPGVATASEAIGVLERGLTEMKLFPAESCGGVGLLSALASPLPQARFCPTGGISPATARDYLALPNVGCVGGSWVTPAATVAAGDWEAVRRLAAETLTLR